MRIVHVCLCGPFSEHMAYQENELVEQHSLMGHSVRVIANTDTYGSNQTICQARPGSSTIENGAELLRLDYYKLGGKFLFKRIRAYKGLISALDSFKPQVILFHGLCAYSLLEVAAYVRSHPGVVLYADSHEDFNNSARTVLSKWILHFCFYRSIFLLSLDAISKVLCVSIETQQFVQSFYGCHPDKVEFFPLGGSLWPDDEYLETRSFTRSEMGWASTSRVFIQTGKIDYAKRLLESLYAFSSIDGEHLVFAVAGSLSSDVASQVLSLAAVDRRIQILGWQSPSRLRKLLAAADIYVQPGTQSATMQMALCCRRPVILSDALSHRSFVDSNGWLLPDLSDLPEVLQQAAYLPCPDLSSMSFRSAQIAATYLDYRRQALRLLLPS